MSKVFEQSKMPRLPHLQRTFKYAERAKRELLQCPVCEHRESQVVATVDRYGLPVRSELCMQCGLVYLNPQMTAAAYNEFYKKWYHQFISAFWYQAFGPRRYQREQRKYAGRLVPFLMQHLPKTFTKSRILDVGGSLGIISAEVRKGLNERRIRSTVTVVDPSASELKYARSLGHDTVPGLIEEVSLKGTWTLGLLCLTSDHLLKPRAALNAIWRVLSKGAYLYADYVNWPLMAKRRGIPRAIHLDHTMNWGEGVFLPFMKAMGFQPISPRLHYTISHGYLFRRVRPSEPVWDSAYVTAVKAAIALGKKHAKQKGEKK